MDPIYLNIRNENFQGKKPNYQVLARSIYCVNYKPHLVKKFQAVLMSADLRH